MRPRENQAKIINKFTLSAAATVPVQWSAELVVNSHARRRVPVSLPCWYRDLVTIAMSPDEN
jgi:hypothetical protein